jgi:hypothetical protein
MAEPKSGLIIADAETFADFLTALANISSTTPFKVRLVSISDGGKRICGLSIGDRHWMAGPQACRAIADVIAESVTVSAISSQAGPGFYAPDESGIVQALRDAADRLDVGRLN